MVIDNLAVEASRRSLYRALAAEFEIHLLVPTSWRETAGIVACEEEEGGEITLHKSGFLFGYRHHRMIYSRLRNVLESVKPDLVLAVHAPENYATCQLLLNRRSIHPSIKLALLASRNIDLPVVGFPFRFAILNRWCDAFTARAKVDAIFHRPQAFAHLYERYTSCVLYLPHSVDCRQFTPRGDDAGGPGKEFVVGYVGRLIPGKGIDVLIKAVAAAEIPMRLDIRGEGEQAGVLRDLVRRMKLEGRVTFSGVAPFRSMPEHLRSLDALVLPSVETSSWKELFGRVLIEAMSCGIPIVASRSGGIEEVVGDAGILVAPGEVAPLAQALDALAASPESCRLLAGRGRTRALRYFDVPCVAGTLAEGLRQILAP
jgi:glycosyltransferase involved in cell wall biosynthesis